MRRRAALAALGAACAVPRSVGAQPAQALRLGISPSDSYAEANYTQAAGLFASNGLSVEIEMLANSGAAAAAVIGGAIDIGIGSPTQLAAARESDIPLYVIAPATIFVPSAPPALLMVAKDSKIGTAGQLTGATIAIDNLGGLPQTSVTTWLRKNGVDPAGVHWLEIPFVTMAAALNAGRCDAAVISEPALTLARPTTRVLANTLAAIGSSFLIAAWFATKSWIDRNQVPAHNFAFAIAAGAGWANAHHAETASVLAELTKVPLPVVQRMTRSSFGERLRAALLDPVLDATYRNGGLKRPFAGADLIAPGFES